jgi:hypothetical protein
VNSAIHKPDFLGFEVFLENFDSYLSGNYDQLINETLRHRNDVYIFITWDRKTYPRKKMSELKEVIDRATIQGLKIGYTFDGNPKLFKFIKTHMCKE